jgi:hypothetical protein
MLERIYRSDKNRFSYIIGLWNFSYECFYFLREIETHIQSENGKVLLESWGQKKKYKLVVYVSKGMD